MSSKPFHSRLLTGILLVLISMLMMPRTEAQTLCECPEPDEQVQVIDICFGGILRQVKVTYCNQTYCPSVPVQDPCNPLGLPITARTFIKGICPIGFVTANAQGLLNATVAALGLCCGNRADLLTCPVATPDVHWIVSWPKCVYFDANACLNACENSPCCAFLVRFQPNNPQPGQCLTTVLANCMDPAPCPPPPPGVACILLDCIYPVACCW